MVQAWLNQDHYEKLYPGQLAYASKRMRVIVDRILSESKTEPIIIIQADHGLKVVPPGFKAHTAKIKYGILNAYCLPDGGDKLLYPDVSPVNSFRIVFNQCFGTDYELLEDITYEVKPAKKGRRFSRVSR